MRPLIAAALAAAVLASAAPCDALEILSRVRIDAPDAPALAERLADAGRDVLWQSVGDDTLELIVSPGELRDLHAAGYVTTLIDTARPFAEIQAERRTADKDIPEGYSDLGAVLDSLQATADAYPEICRLVDLTETYGTPVTELGRHLYALKISDNPDLDEDELSILVVSNFHAREIVPPVIALSVIDSLTSGYGVDPVLTAIVDANEVWVAPIWNPDGYDIVFRTANYWRKNMNANWDGTTGVDLNRNYPVGWDSGLAGSDVPYDSTYKGEAPLSEPESQTMVAWSRDRRFSRVIDLHSSGREVVYGYPVWDYPYYGFYWALSAILADACSYGSASYRAATDLGEHFQWQFSRMSAMAFLLETEREFQPPYYMAEAEAARVWPGLLWYFQKTIPLWGSVTDADTGEPLEAAIELVGVPFEHDEEQTSGGPHGRYQLFVPSGTYHLVFSAPGYVSQEIEDYALVSSSSVRMDVALEPVVSAAGDPGAGPTVIADRADGVLRFALERPADVRLELFDVKGERVRTLVDGPLAAGSHAVPWRGRDDRGRALASGRYLYRLSTGADVRSGKLVLVR